MSSSSSQMNLMLLGVVAGTGVIEGNGVAVCKCLFEYIAPVLPDLVSLISVYNNYQQITQLVLELFRECSHTMLCYLGIVSVFDIERNFRGK